MFLRKLLRRTVGKPSRSFLETCSPGSEAIIPVECGTFVNVKGIWDHGSKDNPRYRKTTIQAQDVKIKSMFVQVWGSWVNIEPATEAHYWAVGKFPGRIRVLI